ncbi:MAG: hypothetical protein GIX03_07505 [Candidatus Eremiobacteraeota bacterium]|nr:hypothetical protein [Candidatus Eremiobacteraeota bacterium]MBC5802837.1 hypothetical protein [Candidatus Eremiobacteraeota bacterium]MBC5820803.1 hypothetical protein [Candidatus Eremiobacteraeota bacterium]
MALVQRALERLGTPTVSVTVARDITVACRPPRAVFVPFMMGHHFGVPGNAELQKTIILAALRLVAEARRSGEIRDLPYTWNLARRGAYTGES